MEFSKAVKDDDKQKQAEMVVEETISRGINYTTKNVPILGVVMNKAVGIILNDGKEEEGITNIRNGDMANAFNYHKRRTNRFLNRNFNANLDKMKTRQEKNKDLGDDMVKDVDKYIDNKAK